MSDSKPRYTLTAALPYTNGPVHIGHLAGVYIPADIYARFLRLTGHDVAFICGSDEHGVAISMKARAEGVAPEVIINRYHTLIKKTFEEFGISFDNYSRTSAEIHHETAGDFFLNLYEKGLFEEKTTEQLYDAVAKQFLADRYVTGTCPFCAYNKAYGDQCENCGRSINTTDLIAPRSKLSNSTPVLKKTKHWFLPLQNYQQFLENWILKGHKKDWKTNVYGQVKSWLGDGLKPRAVTRDLNWGIPVPLADASGKVLYVWFDAPIGYISSTKEWAKENGKNWETYWKDPETRLIHFIGKDNIVFHCIIFPAMLKAHGDYILPQNVPANEFLNLEGQKISTSNNWAVWLHEYLADFKDQQDALRYVLTANSPETKDSDFTWSDFQARNNNELVADFGNFINRVLVLTHKYFKGSIPAFANLTPADDAVLQKLRAFPVQIENSLHKFRFREGNDLLIKTAKLGNKYLGDEEPWHLVKNDPNRLKTVMNVAVQIAAALAVLSEPFLPFASAKLKKWLAFENLPLGNPGWYDVQHEQPLIPEGHIIEKGNLLFAKIEDHQIKKQLEKLKASKENESKLQADAPSLKDIVEFSHFEALDLRTGTILEARKMEKTDKLMVLTVDIGNEKRTVVSGIAQHYQAGELIGKQVSLVLNLKARKLRGVTSEAMILMAEDETGKLQFVSPEKKTQNGAVIS